MESEAITLNNPTRAGCTFTGWKCGDKTVTARTAYSELASSDAVMSIKLKAQ